MNATGPRRRLARDVCNGHPEVATRTFLRDDGGAITVWMVMWSIVFMLLGGVAVDGSKAWRMNAALQAAADAASHSGAMALAAGDAAAARAAAMARAEALLPPDRYGMVLSPDDVTVGRWDVASRSLSATGAADTVSVVLRRMKASGNAEPTTFLRLGGLLGWEVSAASMAQASGGDGDQPDTCWTNGLIARGMVDMQSNNILHKTCIHGQAGVKVSSNSQFLDNSVVSMPDLLDLQMPASGFDSNIGLEAALQQADRDPWIVDYVDEMIYAIRDSNPTIWVNNSVFNVRDAQPGAVYWVYCTGAGGTMIVPSDTVLEDVVVLTNCAISFRKSVVMVNTLMGTTGDRIANAGSAVEAVLEDSNTTVQGAQELRLGLADGCTPGGGSRLLIDGDFKNPAKLRINGSQIIATGDVDIAAQGESIEGLSVLAGGDINVTSNNLFALCDQVDFELPVVRTTVSFVQ